MIWSNARAPSLTDIDILMREAFGRLPASFRAPCGDVVLVVAEFADEETLESLDIQDPFELTGIYHGVELTQKSVLDAPASPDMIVLYRRAILDEWAERGDVSLGELISHILVHEIGHHFGFSDEDMHAIEDSH